MGGTCSAYGGEEWLVQCFSGGNLRKTDHLGDTGVNGRIILIWIFSKWDVGAQNGSSWLRTGTGGGHS
jgi:hypothetical protein